MFRVKAVSAISRVISPYSTRCQSFRFQARLHSNFRRSRPMSPLAIFCIFFFSLALFSTSPAIADEELTAYDVLQQYDFPVGILPKGVASYELDGNSGQFTVRLDKTCSFTIDGYQLRYKTKITGVITKGALKNLSGVQVQVLFLWLNIGEVTRDADELDFSVGIASADFPIDNFYESPQCGCGFDCVNAFGDRSSAKFNWKRLVSSS